MKIVYQPDYTAWQYKCTCFVCTAKLEVDYKDLKYRPDKIYYSDPWDSGGY